MLKYLNFVKEHKFWGKSNSEFLNWMSNKSNKYFIWVDTETTGLPIDNYDVQLTQIACIVTTYDYNLNKFKEIDTYNKKIKLDNETLSHMSDPENRIKMVLSFNHYGDKNTDYHEEKNTLEDFFNFVKKYEDPILVIQNAEFDMKYLNIRNPIVKFHNEVLDTKQILQLFYLPTLLKLSETNQKYNDIINNIGYSDRDNGLISSSLSRIGPSLGINMSGYHDALTDCKLIIQMLEKMIDVLKTNKNLDISKYQSERIKTIRN